MPKVSVPESREEFDACLQSLTPAEEEILFMMLKGLATTQIANQRACSLNVVYTRRSAAYRKFGFHKKDGSYYEEYRQPMFELFQMYASDAMRQEIWGTNSSDPEEIYVSRPDIETQLHQITQQPGSLMRMRGAKHVGKTTIQYRVLGELPQDDYDCVIVSFKEADRHAFQDLRVFLSWFCGVVSCELGLTNMVNELWDDGLAHSYNATRYFETHILKDRKVPLVLALDDVDLVFNHKDIAYDFCALLRGWFDRARRRGRLAERWKNLRLWITHSTEIYAALDINRSPLSNVGKVIPVKEFTVGQIADLAHQNQVAWDNDNAQKLMALIGGHPALVQETFDHLKNGVSLDKILAEAHTESSIYTNYLREHWEMLQPSPELAQDFKQIVDSLHPIQVSTNSSFLLQSMGLTELKGNESKPRNELYRRYFKERLPIPPTVS